MAKPIEHSLLEDAQAFVLGTSMCALGVAMLTHLGLITGQTAGLAVLLSYVTGWSFGAVFFVVNLPFYVLAWLQLGPRFTIKSFIAVALLSAISEIMPDHLSFAHLSPWLGALLIGASIGLGLIVLFRHGASLGGIGVLALFLQERAGIQAGWVQLGFDVALFAAAFAVVAPDIVAYSLAGAVVVNLIVAVNHRKDRYIGR
ncbi:putative 5xTM membrane YitT family protein [Litoreibacter ponti]|uniref:Putative 5xTM membrane YitT family protein n=1 Tax=Litoreibacter ponti TaxID=1510457 RepID=A0A2T6BIF1_9RHOB|nr:YitT family protein [Litoreibacter ponti]PTX55834.1 putative 5xTM membrane YitT family protein [Litoreibacter ponti]